MLRRKWIVVAIGLLGLAGPVSAQRFELTPFAGFVFGGDFETVGEDGAIDSLDIEPSSAFGFFGSFRVSDRWLVEFIYNQQDTDLEVPVPGEEDAVLDTRVEYFHLGGVYQWPTAQNKVRPYIAFSAGLTAFDIEGVSDERPSAGLGGGVRARLTDHFGVRLESRFNATQVSKEEEYCEAGRCVTYGDDSFLLQIDVKGGLIFSW